MKKSKCHMNMRQVDNKAGFKKKTTSRKYCSITRCEASLPNYN